MTTATRRQPRFTARRKIILACRVASRIRGSLRKHQLDRFMLLRHDRSDLATMLERWRKLSGQIAVAGRHGWSAALACLRMELNYLFGDVQRELDEAKRIFRDDFRAVLPAACDLVADLRQLHDEFGDWEFDSQAGTLSVTTEPITLEDIALGSFAIHLRVDRIADLERMRPYRIEALQPNPADGRSDVPHPHVRDEELCEGEATGAIRTALQQGRITDFFMLVNQVLSTYNAESPHVSLSRWHGGVSCHDCGCGMDDDETSYCDRCQHDYCQDCISSCTCCCEQRCVGCLTRCADCDELVCASCLNTCSVCQRSVCDGCRDDGVCTSCREENPDESNDPESKDDAAAGDGDSIATAETDNAADADPVIAAA